MWARRPSEGSVAGNPSPVAVIPARVSQHHPGPLPSRAVSAYPARRHRATIVGSRSGGTRSGEALDRFNKLWARRVLGQGAIVLLITDGLDRDGAVGLGAVSARGVV